MSGGFLVFLEVDEGSHLLAAIRGCLDIGRYERGGIVELHIEGTCLGIGLQCDQRIGEVGASVIIVIVAGLQGERRDCQHEAEGKEFQFVHICLLLFVSSIKCSRSHFLARIHLF